MIHSKNQERSQLSLEEQERESRVLQEVHYLFNQVDAFLKHGDVQQVLTLQGVNTSLAMLISDALKSYLLGDKEKAIEDLSLASEEIAQRYAQRAKADA